MTSSGVSCIAAPTKRALFMRLLKRLVNFMTSSNNRTHTCVNMAALGDPVVPKKIDKNREFEII